MAGFTKLCIVNIRISVLVSQSCWILDGHVDCSSPGFSDHGILQIRILEWVTIPFSRASF